MIENQKEEQYYSDDDIVTERLESVKILPTQLEMSSASIMGTRSYQQDKLTYETDGRHFLGVICDGMGGYEGGELASSLAAQTLTQIFCQEGMDPQEPAAFFIRSAEAMDRKVCAMAKMDGTPIFGGTTAVAVYIRENEMYRLSVGDSRIYLYRDGTIRPLTRLHNYHTQLEEELEEGRIGPKEYEEEKRRGEALTSFIGIGGIELMDVNEDPFLLEDGDIVLLCSDGLYKVLEEEQIANILEACEENFSDAAHVLTEMVESYGTGSIDNVSVMAIRYKGQT